MIYFVWRFTREPARKFFSERSRTFEEMASQAQTQFDSAQAEWATWEDLWNHREEKAKKMEEDVYHFIVALREKTLSHAFHEVERIRKDRVTVEKNEIRKTELSLSRRTLHKSMFMANDYLKNKVEADKKSVFVKQGLETLNNGHVSY